MARRKKEYPDDDGRTIVDMSMVSRPNTWGFTPRPWAEDKPSEPANDDTPAPEPMDKDVRRMYIFGALKAALLIAGVFIAVFGIVIWLMLKVWLH